LFYIAFFNAFFFLHMLGFDSKRNFKSNFLLQGSVNACSTHENRLCGRFFLLQNR
jgi:hypothetical protein